MTFFSSLAWTGISFVLFTALVAIISAWKTRDEQLDTAEGYFLAGQPPQVLRPVGGGVNDTVKAVAKELGYPIINWSVDTEDWKYRDAAHVKQVILEQAGDGDVVLMHDLYPTSVQGALDAIDELQKRTDQTYAFVTVSQLAAIHGITLEPGVVYNGLSDKVAQEIKDGTYSPAEFT